MRPSVLQPWILSRTGCSSREELDRWQIARVRDVLAYAGENSGFYREHLRAVRRSDIRAREDLAQIPFTTADQLRAGHQSWLCQNAAKVERIVTLKTSGTTASPKRIFFSREDQERTVDFFACGMEELVSPGGRVLILMPGQQPGSVGGLLEQGLARINVQAVQGGPVADLRAGWELLCTSGCNCIVGIPVQVLGLAEYIARLPRDQRPRLKSVLLSADAAHPALICRVEELLGCEVFNHFGMTEMGFGVAVECSAHQGCHIRENDILVEVIDPDTGAVLPDGQAGEFVFTTLDRRAMPFLRYRTGDMGKLLPGPCPCGSFVRRMLPQGGRLAEKGRLWALDGVLLACPGVVDYTLKEGALTLYGVVPPDPENARRALAEAGVPVPEHICTQVLTGFTGTGMQKRTL